MPARKLFVPLKADLFTHQREGIQAGLERDNLAIFFEPRLGKTLTALGIVGHRWKLGQVKVVLVVAPKEVLPVWGEQIAEFGNFPVRIINAYKGKRSKREAQFALLQTPFPGVTLIGVNYESVWRFYKELKELGIDCIICDESQKIKGPKSKQSEAMHMLGGRVTYKLCLSGTPTPESPLDIWSQYRFMDTTIFGSDYSVFAARYEIRRPVVKIDRYGGEDVLYEKTVGVRRKKEIAQLMHSAAIRRTIDECLDVPERTHTPYYFDMDPDLMKLHDSLETDEVLRVGEVEFERKTFLDTKMKQQQLTGGFLKVRDMVTHYHNLKGDLLVELLMEMDRKEPALIFTRYIHEFDYLNRRIELEARRSCAQMRGGLNNTLTRREFDAGKWSTLIIQPQVGSLGIDLSRSRTVFFYSPPIKFEEYYQALMRVLGPKQKRKVQYIRLLGKGTVDHDFYAALQAKKNVEDYLCEKYRYR